MSDNMRIFDTKFMFGVGSGISTCGTLDCDICNQTYNPGADENEEYDDSNYISYTQFGDLVVCEHCYETVENAILTNMSTILSWYTKILENRKNNLDNSISQVKAISELLD